MSNLSVSYHHQTFGDTCMEPIAGPLASAKDAAKTYRDAKLGYGWVAVIWDHDYIYPAIVYRSRPGKGAE